MKKRTFLKRLLSVGAVLGLLASMMVPGVAHADVTAVVTTPNPTTPIKTPAEYIVTFTVGAAGALAPGVGQITYRFPGGVTVPSTIAPSAVTINGIPLNNAPVATGTSRQVRLTLPGVLPSGAVAPAVANSGDVTIIFSLAAGILNPKAGGAGSSASKVFTSAEATSVSAATIATYPITTKHSPSSGTRGKAVTTTVKGLTPSAGATLWMDTNSDNDIDTGEVVLASADVDSSGSAVFNWTANVPPMGAGSNSGIKAIDNSGLTTGISPAASFSINRGMTLSPSTVTRGGTITITGQDFQVGDVVEGAAAGTTITDGVTIGGANCGSTTATTATAGTTVAVTATGALPATVFCVVPTTTALGSNTLRLFLDGATTSNDANDATGQLKATVTVVGVPVTLTPSTGVPRQAVTVSASGLTATSIITNANITVGGAQWPTGVAGTTAATTDNSGNMPATSIEIPATQAPGTYQVMVTDAAGLSGVATLTVPDRTITVSPAESLRGSGITVAGTGYPINRSVVINYGTPTISSFTAATNAAGTFSTVITVPAAAGSNSTNTVVANEPVSAFNNTNTVSHSIPGASVTVDPSSAPIGSTVTVTGLGFNGFVGVTSLTVGGLAALPPGGVNTDADGAFSVPVLVPSQNLATTSVSVTAGGTTGTASITVTAEVVTPVTATAALAALVNTQNVNIVTAFDYASGTYLSYVPALAGNSLTTIGPNSVIFVTMTQDTTVTVSGIEFKANANVATPMPVGATVTITV
jgi:hypothetical protein